MKLSDEKQKEHSAIPTSYTSLLSNQTRGYDGTFCGARNIKFHLRNTHVGQLPNRVCMAIVDNDAYTGSNAKNPFNFKHFSASQVEIYLNGEMPAPPSSSILLITNAYMDAEVYLQQQCK